MTFQNTFRMVVPTVVTAPSATRAINAQSRPYSRRSWPSSARRNLRNTERASSMSSSVVWSILDGSNTRGAQPSPCTSPPSAGVARPGRLRRGGELARDVLEDGRHGTAGRTHRRDRDERCVLEQVLAFFVAGE